MKVFKSPTILSGHSCFGLPFHTKIDIAYSLIYEYNSMKIYIYIVQISLSLF